ncbi:MAG: dTMP kinase [Gemmatimonadales bacterium]
MSRGFFLVIEGPDGAGKSTMVAALDGRFRNAGVEPVLVREPGGTPAAEHIRSALLDPHNEFEPGTELLFIAAARAHVVQAVIQPALARGRVVISDRYELSTEAYQMAGRGLPPDIVQTINTCATGGLRPALTLILNVPPTVGKSRQEASGKSLDRLDSETPDFRQRVADHYLAVHGDGVRHLDGTLPFEVLVDLAWESIEGVWEGAPQADAG